MSGRETRAYDSPGWAPNGRTGAREDQGESLITCWLSVTEEGRFSRSSGSAT